VLPIHVKIGGIIFNFCPFWTWGGWSRTGF